MKSLIRILLATCLLAILSTSATASVSVTNDTPGYIKKVVMGHTTDCGGCYYTSFTCEHYLNYGESMSYQDFAAPSGDCTCYYVYSLHSITWIPVSSYTVGLSGPSSICSGCTATFVASVSPNGNNPTLYWFQDGIYLGQAGSTLSLTLHAAGNTTISVSDNQTWGASGAKTASATINVIAKQSPSNGATIGSFSVVHPPIYSAFIVIPGKDTLGLTQATRAYYSVCNCTCTGYILEAGILVNVTQYCYDSRINNAADIALVSNAEAQHLALYQQFVATVGNQYNSMTRTTSTVEDCVNLQATYIDYRNQEFDAMDLNQAALDDPTTGSHPQLGREIKARGGWEP